MNKSQSKQLPQEELDIPELGTLAPVAQPPGCLKYNPKCSSCGYRMKRIYATHQVKTQYSKRKFRSKHRPVGWACFSCGYTDFDGGMLNESIVR